MTVKPCHRRAWRPAALLMLALLAQPACAQQRAVAEPPLSSSLSQAIDFAREGNPGLSAARREVEATEAQVLQGSLRPNPELILQTEDASRPSRSALAELALPYETGGKREARVRAAELGRQVAVTDLASRQLAVRTAVVAAFFEVLAAQDQAVLAADIARLAQRATEVAAKRVAAGKVSPVEETRARVAEAGARVALTQAESELRNARRRLSSLWGNPSPAFLSAEGEVEQLPPLPSQNEVERRLDDSPRLMGARRELERRQAVVELEQARAVPDLLFKVGVKRSLEVDGNLAVVGVQVPLPVSNRNQGNILEALRREDKARDELRALRLELTSQALQALERVDARRAEAELLRTDVLPGAHSAYEAATIGFENGKFSFLEVLDAQRTLFAARSQYLAALASVHRALSELEGLLGEGAQ